MKKSTFIATYRSNGYNFAVKKFTAETYYRAYAQAQNWADLQVKNLVIVSELVKLGK